MNLRKKTLTQKTNSLDTRRLITVQSPFMMLCSGESRGTDSQRLGNQETANWLCDPERVTNYSSELIKFYCNTSTHTNLSYNGRVERLP